MPTHPLFRFMLTALLLVFGVYFFLCIVLFSLQRKLIYLPPSAHSPPSGTSITLTVPDAELSITTREGTGPKALIYFGGNSEEVSYNLFDFTHLFPDTALYLPHYRGYGASTGSPTEQALFSDALALYDSIAKDHSEITLIGRSLGSGVATYLASQRSISQLILITPFDSLENIAAQQFPIFPIRWMLRDRYLSVNYVPLIQAPTLILAAESDEIIPLKNTTRLHETFPLGQSRFILIPRATHNSISVANELRKLLVE